ncbi:hypothetical protein ACGTRS_24730 [Burkholderia semiarida]|uniref:Uncharacterized protein n=1 Tax=Burkholderia semiarida TaxID=2843303 RepID=A0ABW7LBP6_9BURK
MSVQLTSAGIGGNGGVQAGRAGAVERPVAVEARSARAETATSAQGGVPARVASMARQHDLNRHVTAAQRSLSFIDGALRQLREIDGAPPTLATDGRLDARIRRFATYWETRAAATGGALDVALRFDAAGGARRRFAVRALDAAQWAAGGAETVTFYPRGIGKRSATVSFDAAALSPAALVRKLDHALAPAGVRVERDARGAPVFSVPEGEWDAVRDGMMIEGGGKRFPGGRPGRAAVAAGAGVIEPRQWRGGGREATSEISGAIDALLKARRNINRALETVEQSVRMVDAPDVADAKTIMQDLHEALGPQREFQAFAVTVSAFKGISGERVRSLLAQWSLEIG